MTAYTDFTRDFPKRCLEVLDAASSGAVANGREITLLYMAASVSLLVPFERLKPDTEDSDHPFGDNRRYKSVADRLKRLLDEKFVGSELCPGDQHSWKLAKGVQSVEGDVDSWLPKATLKAFSSDRLVKSTLSLIRNALAHGSIYTTGNPIQELVFVKEVLDKDRQRVGFEVIQVSSKDFRNFVRAWVNFLNASDKDAGNKP